MEQMGDEPVKEPRGGGGELGEGLEERGATRTERPQSGHIKDTEAHCL